jgi:hypothetical protein
VAPGTIAQSASVWHATQLVPVDFSVIVEAQPRSANSANNIPKQQLAKPEPNKADFLDFSSI